MRRVGLIAGREFVATVASWSFVIGLLMMPLLLGLFGVSAPFLFGPRTVEIRGQVAIIDPTGRVADELRRAVGPSTQTALRNAEAERTLARAPGTVRRMPGGRQAIAGMAGPLVALEIVERAAGSDVEREKAWLTRTDAGERHLALVMVHDDAVEPPARQPFGGYDLYLPENVGSGVEDAIHDSMHEAIVNARVRLQNVDRVRFEALMRVPRGRSLTVTEGSERENSQAFNIMLPVALAGLLAIGIMIGGPALLTSTSEEKASRVMEVLLSAVSPLELMAGKIVGQLAVSLLVLLVYTGLGLAMLVSFAVIGLLDPWLLAYFFLFFLLTFVLFAALFAAAGSTVNDTKEAQTLMGPLILVLMGPLLLAFPIANAPDSPFAIALSFMPPVNAFFMMLRLASSTPPPAWQAMLSIAVSLLAACAGVWFAARVFRIGLLIHGKPPDFRTLVRWVRMG